MLEITTEEEVSTLTESLKTRLQGVQVEVARAANWQIIKLRGLDAITTAKEVQDAVSGIADACSSEDVKILEMHVYKWQQTSGHIRTKQNRDCPNLSWTRHCRLDFCHRHIRDQLSPDLLLMQTRGPYSQELSSQEQTRGTSRRT